MTECKKMQIKVLYSFNSHPTVFLSRSKQSFTVKIAQIPNPTGDTEYITLGAIELKSCIQQIITNSPENFHLTTEDYAVYYKDLTEQPDEPFVSNGVLLSLITSSKSHLIPGRVCQNLSASFLFGNAPSPDTSLTLEIRLKLHTIDQPPQLMGSGIGQKNGQKNGKSNQYLQESLQLQQEQREQQYQSSLFLEKRPLEHDYYNLKKIKSNSNLASNSSSSAVKATRTLSLPIYPNIPSKSMFNIINLDKSNKPSKYDSSSVKDRFTSAPFLQSKILETPSQRRKRNEAMRAMRTRSMTTFTPLVSSPIQEEANNSDSSDDADYRIDEENENTLNIDENDNNEINDQENVDLNDNFEITSPYTPQQPPYKAIESGHNNNLINSSNLRSRESKQPSSASSFHSLPDFEDLNSKRTHTIHQQKLPDDHGLVCVNPNCATIESIAWRYFETGFHKNYFDIHRSQTFDKKHYDGMFGPLCNACFLFLRNKGFMRPEPVVKKYLQQQKYKLDSKKKEKMNAAAIESHTSGKYNHSNGANSNLFTYNNRNKDLTSASRMNSDKMDITNSSESLSLSSIAAKKSHKLASSPNVASFHKFPTPTHTPSTINQVIQNQKSNNNYNNNTLNHSDVLSTPNFNDLNDFMNELNNYGGPLTDIDPLPRDHLGITPPMMAEKSNTRVINLYNDGDDKENYPPPGSPSMNDFESMLAGSFATSEKSSPAFHQDWVNSLFNAEPTPVDGSYTPQDFKNFTEKSRASFSERLTPLDQGLDMKSATVRNMPSSPVATSEGNDDENENDNDKHNNKRKPSSSSPVDDASRNDTTNLLMSWAQTTKTNDKEVSSPTSEFMNHDEERLMSKASVTYSTISSTKNSV